MLPSSTASVRASADGVLNPDFAFDLNLRASNFNLAKPVRSRDEFLSRRRKILRGKTRLRLRRRRSCRSARGRSWVALQDFDTEWRIVRLFTSVHMYQQTGRASQLVATDRISATGPATFAQEASSKSCGIGIVKIHNSRDW